MKHERERKRLDSAMERRDYRHYQLGTAREFKMERRATETVEREARLAVQDRARHASSHPYLHVYTRHNNWGHSHSPINT